jgi:FkbM family methyltransferase
MRARERFAPRRLVLVARDIGRRTARRLGIPVPMQSPRAAVRRSMSRATPTHGRWHGRLQQRYRSREIRRFLAPVVRRGELAFDVGANVGEWSRVMRSLGCRLVVVEPQADCVVSLRRSFAGDDEVAVVQAAVGDWIGSGELRPSTPGVTHASMSGDWQRTSMEKGYMPPEAWLAPIEVPVVTLDSLIERHGAPHYCKVDVEGFEPEVLRGLSQALPGVDFEFHQDLARAVEECVERLAELGEYRYRIFIGEWPEEWSGELAAPALSDAVAGLDPGTWGMIRARHV